MPSNNKILQFKNKEKFKFDISLRFGGVFKMNSKVYVTVCLIALISLETCSIANAAIYYVPDDYEKIQWAINNASAGDIIYVKAGTYYERIVVDEAVVLIGENRNTILDGNGEGTVVTIVANNVTLENFTIRNSGRVWYDSGIWLNGCMSVQILNNNVTNCGFGIWLDSSSNNMIFGNNVTANDYHGLVVYYSHNNTLYRNNVRYNGYDYVCGLGIYLVHSSNNVLLENTMFGNNFNFGVWGVSVRGISIFDHYINFVDTSNTVDGRPIYYWIDRHNDRVPLDAGFVALVNCTNITIENLNLVKNLNGILVAYTEHSIIKKNNITTNYIGIGLFNSSNNMAMENEIASNYYGFLMHDSFSNTISSNYIIGNVRGIHSSNSNNNLIYNNYFNNSNNVYSYNSVNIWNVTKQEGVNLLGGNYLGGNYWSDYSGTDEDNDGLGDQPYIIDPNNVDWHPIVVNAVVTPIPELSTIQLILATIVIVAIIIARKLL